jgi:hypothetical protein
MGACQAFLSEVGTVGAFYALILMAIMCNEAVLTSELLEGPSALAYTLPMKLVDLGTFVVLSYALVVLSPQSNVFYDKPPAVMLPGAGRPWVFLLLLALYGALTILWNTLAGRNKKEQWRHPIVLYVGRSLAFVFLVCSLLNITVPSFDLMSPLLGFFLFSGVVAYMLLKPWALKPLPVPASPCKFVANG